MSGAVKRRECQGKSEELRGPRGVERKVEVPGGHTHSLDNNTVNLGAVN